MPLEEVPCSSPRSNSQRAHNTVCSLENYVLDVDRFLGRISPVCGALPVECHKPGQSPAPGFGEKYWSLSGFPSHSLESGGGAFLTVIFGQILANSAFSDSHFSSPGSLSALIASIVRCLVDCITSIAESS